MEARKPILWFWPLAKSKGNAYIGNLTSLLSRKYSIVGADEFFKIPFAVFRAHAAHFNWIENIHGKNLVTKWLDYTLRKGVVFGFDLFGKKIVWTVHNKVSHDKGSSYYSKKMMEYVARHADVIHCMCRESMELPFVKPYIDKCVVIPHGDYMSNYGSTGLNLYEKYHISKDKKIVLFLGAIKPYKNLELLAQSFKDALGEKDSFFLLVAGKCRDKAYQSELESLSSGESGNIHFDFNFVPSETIVDYLKQAEILVAPYDLGDSMNSGTYWMACSFEKTMIMPKLGCVSDFEIPDNYGYFYTYQNDEEHRHALTEAIRKYMDDSEHHPDSILQKEKNCFNYINENSWENNREKWEKLYE